MARDIFKMLAKATPEERAALAATLTDEEVRQLEAYKAAAGQRECYARARTDFLAFCRLMTPDRNAPTDVTRTEFMEPAHIRLIAEALTRIANGTLFRLIVTMPPRHGKSETITRLFPCFYVGRDPTREVILASYNQDFAERSFGKKIQRIMNSPRYLEVFPRAGFEGGSKAVDSMMLAEGGHIMSAGRGGSITGLGAHLFVIDDPLKNQSEAESETILSDLWEWFTKTAITRLYAIGAMIIVATRWNEDDLIGRLTDPEHPEYDPSIAKGWTVLHLPAIFEQEHSKIAKALGKKVGDTLWPEMGFDRAYMEEHRKLSEQAFSSLYQGDPSPMDGDQFKVDWLVEHKDPDSPVNGKRWPKKEDLNFYGASDHGVSLKTRADPTVIGCVGVDENHEIWVMPDLEWDKMPTDKTVDAIIAKIKFYKPFTWWLEDELISKSFGPFLFKRIAEERAYYTVIDPSNPGKDKVKRAQSIRGLMAYKRVHFPAWAHWWRPARKQLLNFPNGAQDDFVDWLSWIGTGIMKMAPGEPVTEGVIPPHQIPGTIAWIKHQTARQERTQRRAMEGQSGY